MAASDLREAVQYEPSDDEVRRLYHALIGRSWESVEDFEVNQRAWQVVAQVWGIQIDGNGHGAVLRDLRPLDLRVSQIIDTVNLGREVPNE